MSTFWARRETVWTWLDFCGAHSRSQLLWMGAKSISRHLECVFCLCNLLVFQLLPILSKGSKRSTLYLRVLLGKEVKPWEPNVCGYSRVNRIIPGFLRWCGSSSKLDGSWIFRLEVPQYCPVTYLLKNKAFLHFLGNMGYMSVKD